VSILQQDIDDLEAQAAARSRIARLTIDPEQRAHSARLSHELRLLVRQLRARRDALQ
jgi:hypothetical protein